MVSVACGRWCSHAGAGLLPVLSDLNTHTHTHTHIMSLWGTSEIQTITDSKFQSLGEIQCVGVLEEQSMIELPQLSGNIEFQFPVHGHHIIYSIHDKMILTLSKAIGPLCQAHLVCFLISNPLDRSSLDLQHKYRSTVISSTETSVFHFLKGAGEVANAYAYQKQGLCGTHGRNTHLQKVPSG